MSHPNQNYGYQINQLQNQFGGMQTQMNQMQCQINNINQMMGIQSGGVIAQRNSTAPVQGHVRSALNSYTPKRTH